MVMLPSAQVYPRAEDFQKLLKFIACCTCETMGLFLVLDMCGIFGGEGTVSEHLVCFWIPFDIEHTEFVFVVKEGILEFHEIGFYVLTHARWLVP